MKRKKTFNIGEVSRLFNISVDSIRYYEKIGILEPTRNEGNNYRVYTLSDIRQLTMIRELLGLNFSTERIKEFDRNQNVETTKMLLSEELNIVNKNIVELFEKKVSIEARIKSLEEKENSYLREENFKKKDNYDLDNKISVLENFIENGGNLPNSIKSIMNNPRLNGIHDVIGNLVTIDYKFSKALDIALGASKQFLVVDNEMCAKDAINYLKENKIKYEFTPEIRLNKMVREHHQGVVIDIDDYEYYKLEDIIDENFLVCLDHLEDPHNLGAIIRTCECAGIKGIIIPKDRSIRVNETVMKISAGAINNVKIVEVSNLSETLRKLQKNMFFVYTADMDGLDYRRVDYADKKVLVIGAEGNGVSPIIRKNSDEIISIPMYGKINSLNASVSAAILIYGMIKE